ncbi:hypothetical protein AMTR_s00055p00185690 [Amborella trichopoda]|uniref:DM2 domain-containing protein n=1 Tax=Amborella trichopoda TaxID=13333 RepID=U5DD35_AMBTC|nr:hypothetical protein AMTR_s00055p00185690 [Amborella trichopoda]
MEMIPLFKTPVFVDFELNILNRKHRIDEDLGTLERNHIKFPEDPAMKKGHATIPKSGKEKVLKKRGTVSEESSEDERPTFKAAKQIAKEYSSKKEIDSLENGKLVSAIKIIDFTKNCRRLTHIRMIVKAKLKDTTPSKHEKSECSEPIVDKDMQEKILSLIKKSTDSLSLKKMSAMVLETLESPLHQHLSFEMDNDGECGDITSIVSEQDESLPLTVLHGNRYTSFGRHFTNREKLKEIVEELHWYVQDNDMVVDFCCGANDFSLLMKYNLEETGKKCFFKNYDIIQPKLYSHTESYGLLVFDNFLGLHVSM